MNLAGLALLYVLGCVLLNMEQYYLASWAFMASGAITYRFMTLVNEYRVKNWEDDKGELQ